MACRGASSRAPFNENSGYSDTPDEIINQATVAPIKYLLKIRPVLDKGDPDFTVNTADVIVHAHVTTLEQSNKIYLTHRNLQVDLEQVTVVKNGQVLSISNISDKQDKPQQVIPACHAPLPTNSTLKIELTECFDVEEELQVYIPYRLQMTEALHHSPGHSVILSGALAFDEYVASNKDAQKFAVTTLEKYECPKVIPLFITTNLGLRTKWKFEIIVGRLDKHETVSNMELDHTEPDLEHPGWMWDHYNETFPLWPQNIFILVSTLNIVTFDKTAPRISVHATAPYLGEKVQLIASVVSTAEKLLQFYGHILNTPFPLKTLKIVIPPSITAYQAEYLGVILLNEVHDKLPSEEDLVSLIATKIANQWMGIIVSTFCWQCRYETQLEQELFTYLRHLGMHHCLSKESYLKELFDRGHSTLKMMEEIFGAEVMHRSLAHFVEKCLWKVASEDNLYDAMDEVIKSYKNLLPTPKLKMRDVIPDWLKYYQELVVTVKIVDAKTLKFMQHLSGNNNDADKPSTFYWTPVIIETEGESGNESWHKCWIPKNSTEVIYTSEDLDTGRKLVINPYGTAPYKVVYQN